MSRCIVTRTAILGGAAAFTLALGQAACSNTETNQSASSPSSSTTVASSKDTKEAVDRLDASSGALHDFRERIPDDVASMTRCAVVIPSMMQGGLVVGGQHGEGFASCRTDTGWSAPAPISISGGSVGAQVGVQSVDLLALVLTESAKAALIAGHFRVGVDASASAGPVGTGAGTGFKLGSDVVSYSKSSGLFAGAALNGATIDRDDTATRTLYGQLVDLRSILDGQLPMPAVPSAEHFVGTVRSAFGTGNVGQDRGHSTTHGPSNE